MGRFTAALAAATILLGVSAPLAFAVAAVPESEVSPQAFHQRLSPYGHWFEHPRWGEVWHPTEVPADFRPYRDGHWENTADYGTVWVSDYSAAADERGRWGDVVFHYGRWGYDPAYGWLWVPGYTWSPAWVVWRQGGGNIGWFPMPPGAYDGVGDYPDDWAGWYGYRGWYGAALTAPAFFAMWSFVPSFDIFAPEIGVDIIAAGGYGGFIGRTTAWTRFDVVDGHLANRAIDGARFHAAFGRELPLSARSDFIAHHGPIIGLDRSRRLEMGHGYLHAAYPGAAHLGATHHVAGYGMERSAMHGPYGHTAMRYTHTTGFPRSEPRYARPNYGGYGLRSGADAHPMTGGSGMGYAQRPMGGYAQHSQGQPSTNTQHHH